MADKKIPPFNLFSWVSEQFKPKQALSEQSRANASPSAATASSAEKRAVGESDNRPAVRPVQALASFLNIQGETAASSPRTQAPRTTSVPIIRSAKSASSAESVSTGSSPVKFTVFIKLVNGGMQTFYDVSNLEQLRGMVKEGMQIEQEFSLLCGGKPVETMEDFMRALGSSESDGMLHLVAPRAVRTAQQDGSIVHEKTAALPAQAQAQINSEVQWLEMNALGEAILNAASPNVVSTDSKILPRSVAVKLITGRTAFFNAVSSLDEFHEMLKEKFQIQGRCTVIASGQRVETNEHFLWASSNESGCETLIVIPPETSN